MASPRFASLVLAVGLLVACGNSGGAGSPDAGDGDGGPVFRVDGGVDMGVDMGSTCGQPALAGETGGACRGGDLRMCNDGLSCITEARVTVGGTDDPIQNHPMGASHTYELVDFPGDYCAGVLGSSGSCSATDRFICASVCGVCASVFSDANICLRQCTPNATDNDICRDGYRCDFLRGACDVGCASDDECRVSRQDTDMNGMIEPFDSMAGTGDNLVYNVNSAATCNPVTARCEHPGTMDAEAGDPCTFDDDCEANGRCLTEVGFDFPGGYCSKYRCDFTGNDCAGDGVCQARGIGFPACLQGCTLGTGATPGDTMTYVNNNQGCRAGYTCRWDGTSGAAASPNGACVPGEFNAVTTPNIGEPCDEDSDCYSPFGNGVCLRTGYPEGYCSVIDCSTPGMPDDVCGPDGVCVLLGGDTTLCVRDCDTAEDCRDTYACSDIDMNLATQGTACFPDCFSNSECRAGETCTMNVCTPAP